MRCRPTLIFLTVEHNARNVSNENENRKPRKALVSSVAMEERKHRQNDHKW